MPDLTTDQLTVALAVVAGVLLVLLLILALRVGKLRKDYVILRGDGNERDIVAVVSRVIKQIEALNRRLDEIVASQEEQAAIGRFSLQKFGIVRFDAFEEMGGRLSFSAAILDDHGDGLVITSINGRTETRTYAKPIKALESEHNLSEEEREAIAGAAAGFGRSEMPASAAR